MKLVYFIDGIQGMGGMERIIIGKANALANELNHDVTIISAYSSDKPICYPIDSKVRFVSLDIEKARHDCNALMLVYEQMRVFLQTLCRTRRQLRQIKPDAIFFVWVLGAIMLPFVGGKARKIFESHSSLSNTPHHFFLRLMEQFADTIVTLTEGNAKEFKHCKDVRVIPNYTQKPSKRVIDYSAKRAIAVGRLDPVKGFDRLIRMWKNTENLHADWTLDIFGEGPLEDELRQQIVSSHLTDSVRLRGYSDNIIDEYSNYSIHLMTSHAEGQGLVLLEAQAAGLPSVTFNFQFGASDVVTNESNGLLVAQDDEIAFQQAMCRIMNSEEDRKRMGEENYRQSCRFTKESIIKLWDKLLKDYS